jgi:hypothetical protein
MADLSDEHRASTEAAGLSDEHRASIEAALPPDVIMSPEAWDDLVEIINSYRSFEHHRTTYPKERKRWKRLDDAVEQAAVELRRLRCETPWSDLANRALTALWDIHCKVEEERAAFCTIWDAFNRRKNPYRQVFLYGGIMRVWTDRLGGELRYSNKPGKPPYGPLVRFLKACLEPLLGDQTPNAGIADIIERERVIRAWLRSERQLWIEANHSPAEMRRLREARPPWSRPKRRDP